MGSVSVRRYRISGTIANKRVTCPSCATVTVRIVELPGGLTEIANAVNRIGNATAKRINGRTVAETRQDAFTHAGQIYVCEEERLVMTVVNLGDHDRSAQGKPESVVLHRASVAGDAMS